MPQHQLFLNHKHRQKKIIMDFLGSIRHYFFQLKNNIEWFHSFIGTNAEISNDEMPKMQEQNGDQKRQTARKSTATRTRKELGVHVLTRGTRSTSTLPPEENTLNEEPEEEKI